MEDAPKILAHCDLPQYLRAEFEFPIVYRADGVLATRVALVTQQRLPSPVSVHAWRLTRVRIDGREFPSSDRFNERVISLSDVGRTLLPDELRFPIPKELANSPQVTISAQVQVEVVNQGPPPALLPVDERTCRMAG